MSTDSFIQAIIDAHGGLSLFSQLSAIEVEFNFTGATLGLKGRPARLVPRATISTQTPKVVFQGLSEETQDEWIFTPQRVWKQSSENGTVLDYRDNPRAAFADHSLTTPWDDFHFTYFCGYALWQYFNFPFLLARDDVEAHELESHREQGQIWRVLQVTYPEQSVLATHTQIQKYYFNKDFILQRHDYAPDVLGGSPAAQYTYDEIKVDGLLFPAFRRVLAMSSEEDGKMIPMVHGPIPTLIHLVFHKIELVRNGDKGSR